MKPTKWVLDGENPTGYSSSIKKGETVWTAKATRGFNCWTLDIILDPWKSIHWEHTTSLQQAKRRGNAILRVLAGDTK